MELTTIAAALGGTPGVHGTWYSKCPVHGGTDHDMTMFSIAPGTVEYICTKGCKQEQIEARVNARLSGEQQPVSRKFQFDTLGQILDNVKVPSWLVRDYIETDTHILVFGESESCKSFLMLDIALHVAAGMDWCGQPVKQGAVFYINGEGRGGFGRRVKAWCIARKMTETDIPFFVSRRPTRFYDEDAALDVSDAIRVLAREHGNPAMVVIDTLAKNLGADENSNQDIGEYVRHVDELITRPFGCTVSTVHHVGHGDKTRARGAYALKGDFDADMMIVRDKTVISDQVIFQPGKMKDGQPGQPLAFNIRVVELGIVDTWDRPVTSIVLDQTDYTPRLTTKKLGKTQQSALDELEVMYAEARRNLKKAGHDPDGAMVEVVQWRERLELKSMLGKYSRQNWIKIRDGLVQAEQIEINGAHVSIKA